MLPLLCQPAGYNGIVEGTPASSTRVPRARIPRKNNRKCRRVPTREEKRRASESNRMAGGEEEVEVKEGNIGLTKRAPMYYNLHEYWQ
ncbi:hypothetical protein M0802_011846 [Mischocyttarus mexicanus]|nr:hypothetical protein M0802_011846 [Mischocyttarus mexicanus]